MRRMLPALVGLLVLAPVALGQEPARLRWTKGQVLTYRLDQATEAADVAADGKSEAKSVLKVTKRWDVTDVDAAGVATLQMSVTAMYQERTSPGGDVVKYDSADPDKSEPKLKEVLSRYLNTPLATIRVDGSGKVVEVKAAKSDASGFENELPFIVVLPTAGLKAGAGWQRDYKITLAPPLGTGEKYEAVQKCVCKSVTATTATIGLTTELKTPPKAAADAIPLWQLMPDGEVVIDVANGRLQSAKLEIKKEIKEHQGAGSSYAFKSTLTLQYVDK